MTKRNFVGAISLITGAAVFALLHDHLPVDVNAQEKDSLTTTTEHSGLVGNRSAYVHTVQKNSEDATVWNGANFYDEHGKILMHVILDSEGRPTHLTHVGYRDNGDVASKYEYTFGDPSNDGLTKSEFVYDQEGRFVEEIMYRSRNRSGNVEELWRFGTSPTRPEAYLHSPINSSKSQE